MRKIVIGSGLGLVAAAMPAHSAPLPIATEPAGVSEAGQIRFAEPDANTQGVLIGLNKPGTTDQIKQQDTYDKFKSQDKFNSQIKMNPYDKMNAEAQLKIKGENQVKFNGDGRSANGIVVKTPTDSQIKYGAGPGGGPNAGLLCDGVIGPSAAKKDAIKYKSTDTIKYGSGGGEGVVAPGN